MGSLNPENERKQDFDDSGHVQDDPASEEVASSEMLDKISEDPGPEVDLLDLPDDALLYILQYLSPRDLKALGYTCSRLGALVLDRTLWQRVDTRAEPCGQRRMRWLLAHALSRHTTALCISGYAREAKGCIGYVNTPSRTQTLIQERNGAGTKGEAPTGQGRVYHLTAQSTRNGSNISYWPEAPSHEPGSPEPTGHNCPGPQISLTPAALARLCELCTNLTELALDYCVIDCFTIKIAMFPRTIKKLSLRGTKCFNSEKSFLYKIQDRLGLLEDLDVSECEWIEPACMLPLSKMPRLSRLIMADCYRLSEFVAYASLATRYGFKTLKVLDLRRCPVGDSEVSALGWVPRLEELYLAPAPPVPRPAPHAHCSRDPMPPHTELNRWEEQEPEYYESKYAGEQWIRDEMTSVGRNTFMPINDSIRPPSTLERIIAEPLVPPLPNLAATEEELDRFIRRIPPRHNVPPVNPGPNLPRREEANLPQREVNQREQPNLPQRDPANLPERDLGASSQGNAQANSVQGKAEANMPQREQPNQNDQAERPYVRQSNRSRLRELNQAYQRQLNDYDRVVQMNEIRLDTAESFSASLAALTNHLEQGRSQNRPTGAYIVSENGRFRMYPHPPNVDNDAGGNENDAGGNEAAGGNENNAGGNENNAGGNENNAGSNDNNAGGNGNDAGGNEVADGNENDAGGNEVADNNVNVIGGIRFAGVNVNEGERIEIAGDNVNEAGGDDSGIERKIIIDIRSVAVEKLDTNSTKRKRDEDIDETGSSKRQRDDASSSQDYSNGSRSTNIEVGSSSNDTGSSSGEPVSSSNEPGRTNDEPVSSSNEPASTCSEPGSTSNEAESSNNESTSLNNEPGTSNDDPCSSKQELCPTKASRKYYDDQNCQVSRALLKDSLKDFKRRTEDSSGPIFKPNPDFIDSDDDASNGDDGDDDDDDDGDDKPVSKRARIAVNEGVSSSNSDDKVDNDEPTTSKCAKNESSTSSQESSNSSNEPNLALLSKQNESKEASSSSNEESSQASTTQKSDTKESKKSKLSIQSSTLTKQPSALTIQPIISSTQPSTSSIQPCTSSIQPSALSIQPITSSTQPSTSSTQPSTSSTQQSTSNIFSTHLPSTESSHASTSNEKSAEPKPQKYVRFRHNEAPVMIEDNNNDNANNNENNNNVNNNDVEQPDWNNDERRDLPAEGGQGPNINAAPPHFREYVSYVPARHYMRHRALYENAHAPDANGDQPAMNEMPRHRVLYINIGRMRHAMYQVDRQDPIEQDIRRAHIPNAYRYYLHTGNAAPLLEYTSLVTDAAIRRFGRADGENINYVQIGPMGPVPAPYDDPHARPDRSSLRILSVTGYRHITNYSLTHLATAAPHLQFVDFTGTRVTEAGVQRFRDLRPECRVKYGTFEMPKEDSDRPHSR